MTDSDFEYDRKVIAQYTKDKMREGIGNSRDAIRLGITEFAADKPYEYRCDLFTVLRETWYEV